MTVLLLFLFGLAIGSFVNVLIYRIPRDEPFALGRSHCPHCRKTLAPYDLIPVISWLALGGRCRNCRKSISLWYPAIELVSGALFVVSYQVLGPSLAPWFLAIAILEILLAIAVIDYQHLIIPDQLVIALLVVALLGLWHTHHVDLGHFISALGSGGFFFLLWLISKGRWIGFGDVKLAAVLGLAFGFPGSVLIIYAAVVLGGVISVILLLLKKATMKTAIPLGSLLSVAAGSYLLLYAHLPPLPWLYTH